MLSADAIKQLKNHQYAGVDHSLLSKYVLQPYWSWLVTLFPYSIAYPFLLFVR